MSNFKEIETGSRSLGSKEFPERNQLGDVDSREFGRRSSMSAKSKRSEKKKPQKQQEPNLGQKEAEQQERSESELSHMGGSNSPRTTKTNGVGTGAIRSV
jgi:hypothetical protein